MATKLGAMTETVNTKLLNENVVYINKTHMESLRDAITKNEKALADAYNNLATKTSTAVKKNIFMGAHNDKISKFAATAKSRAKIASQKGNNLKAQITSGVNDYVIHLISKANSFDELKADIADMLK